VPPRHIRRYCATTSNLRLFCCRPSMASDLASANRSARLQIIFTYLFIRLAHPACLPGGLYILWLYIVYKYGDDWRNVCLFLYFCEKNCNHEHIRPIISERARPISIIYSTLIDIWVGIINLMFVFRSLKGRCYGSQLIWGHFLQTSKLTAFSLRSRVP